MYINKLYLINLNKINTTYNKYRRNFLNRDCEMYKISEGYCPSENFSVENISAVSKEFSRKIRYNCVVECLIEKSNVSART